MTEDTDKKKERREPDWVKSLELADELDGQTRAALVECIKWTQSLAAAGVHPTAAVTAWGDWKRAFYGGC